MFGAVYSPVPQGVPIRTVELPSGEAGARGTADLMRDLIAHGERRGDVAAMAAAIAGDARTRRERIVRCWDWVRRNIRYVLDPKEHELLRSAEVTLRDRIGDCDCQTILLGSLLGALGVGGRSLMLCRASRQSNRFSHVLLGIELDGRVTPLETIVRLPFGALPKQVHGYEVIGIGDAMTGNATISGCVGALNGGPWCYSSPPSSQVGDLGLSLRWKRGGKILKKAKKGLKKAGRAVEKGVVRVVRQPGKVLQSAGRTIANPKLLAKKLYAVAYLGPAALVMNANALDKLKDAVRPLEQAIGIPLIPTTAKEWFKRAKLLAMVMPGSAAWAPALSKLENVYASGSKSRQGRSARAGVTLPSLPGSGGTPESGEVVDTTIVPEQPPVPEGSVSPSPVTQPGEGTPVDSGGGYQEAPAGDSGSGGGTGMLLLAAAAVAVILILQTGKRR